MPYNGSGVYSLPSGNPVVTGTVISSTVQNSTMSDVASALSNVVCKDGQTTPSANLPMGGFKHTGVGNATSRDQYCTAGQAQDNSFDWLSSVSGTDTITATAPIALSAYAAGQCFRFVSAGANTGAVTLNINGIGAKSITKYGSTALAAGDIPSGAIVEVVYDGTQFQLVGNGLSTYAPLNSPTFTGTASFTGTVTLSGNAVNALDAVPKQQLDAIKQIQPVTASVASNALTVGLNPTSLNFRDPTLTNGVPNARTVASAISLTVPSGATLGTISGQSARLVLIAIDNAGTVELAVVNLAGGNNLDETTLISTTAISSSANSANVIYSTTARTNVPFRVVGFVDITETTAGIWATAPTLVQGAGGQALTALPSIGFGQSWQVVTGSRTSGTVYTNTTGKPIQVTCNCNANGTLTLTVNGVVASTMSTSTAGAQAYVNGIVPPGATYSVTVTGTTISSWSELR